MRLTFRKFFLISALLILAISFSQAEPVPAAAASAKHHSKSKHRKAKKGSWKRHGQQVIQPERAREIQEALIRKNYLSGEATGVWDARTQAAMVKFQGDNGWQTKVTPDSRALIKLGLGPDYSRQQTMNRPAQTAVAAATSNSTHAAAVADKQ